MPRFGIWKLMKSFEMRWIEDDIFIDYILHETWIEITNTFYSRLCNTMRSNETIQFGFLFRMHFLLVHGERWAESEYFATMFTMITASGAGVYVIMFLEKSEIIHESSEFNLVEETKEFTSSFFRSLNPWPHLSHLQRSFAPGLCRRLCSINALRFGDTWPHSLHVCGP